MFFPSINAFYFALGVLLTTAVNIAKVALLDRAVRRALKMEEQAGANYVRVQYLLRFLLTALVLVIAAVVPFIDLWGAAAGIFTLQVAGYTLGSSYLPADVPKTASAVETADTAEAEVTEVEINEETINRTGKMPGVSEADGFHEAGTTEQELEEGAE
jgi:hypothetical protein